jgi:hypothetical protein
VASGVAALALYRLLRSEIECEEGGSFSPDDVTRLSAAYEHTLELLELKDRTDPITTIIAKKIIDVFKSGEHDAGRLCSRAIQELGIQIRPRS